jgi:hypothetical protein
MGIAIMMANLSAGEAVAPPPSDNATIPTSDHERNGLRSTCHRFSRVISSSACKPYDRFAKPNPVGIILGTSISYGPASAVPNVA